ncbi:unnamed protein product [Lampetra planeri]
MWFQHSMQYDITGYSTTNDKSEPNYWHCNMQSSSDLTRHRCDGICHYTSHTTAKHKGQPICRNSTSMWFDKSQWFNPAAWLGHANLQRRRIDGAHQSCLRPRRSPAGRFVQGVQRNDIFTDTAADHEGSFNHDRSLQPSGDNVAADQDNAPAGEQRHGGRSLHNSVERCCCERDDTFFERVLRAMRSDHIRTSQLCLQHHDAFHQDDLNATAGHQNFNRRRGSVLSRVRPRGYDWSDVRLRQRERSLVFAGANNARCVLIVKQFCSM